MSRTVWSSAAHLRTVDTVWKLAFEDAKLRESDIRFDADVEGDRRDLDVHLAGSPACRLRRESFVRRLAVDDQPGQNIHAPDRAFCRGLSPESKLFFPQVQPLADGEQVGFLPLEAETTVLGSERSHGFAHKVHSAHKVRRLPIKSGRAGRSAVSYVLGLVEDIRRQTEIVDDVGQITSSDFCSVVMARERVVLNARFCRKNYHAMAALAAFNRYGKPLIHRAKPR